MKTFDMNRPLTSKALNEALYKNFNVKINFDKYTREQLENYRNLLRTKVSQSESQANFNELLSNESYQKDKFILGVLNTRIKEMLGEASDRVMTRAAKGVMKYGKDGMKALAKAGKEGKNLDNVRDKYDKYDESVVSEKAVSKQQQKFMGMVYAAKKGEKPASKEVAKAAKGMSKKDARDFAATKHKGLPKKVSSKEDESVDENFSRDDLDAAMKDYKSKGGKVKTLPAKPPRKSEKTNFSSKHIGGSGDKMKASRTGRGANTQGKPVVTAEDNMTPKQKKFAALAEPKDKITYADKIAGATKKGKTESAGKCCCETKGKAKCPIHGKKVDETLKGGQKKLDKNHNGKLDKKDFEMLRGEKKKKVKESTELMHQAYQQFIAEGIAYYIAEDEEGKAKAITAAADMVNDFTSWMQRVGNYQTKSMIELADNIRANFGMQEAEAFKQSVGQALEGALNALTAAREEINNAVAVLAGEAPAVDTMGASPDMGEPDLATDLAPAAADDMNIGADEFAASDAAAGGPETTGRMKRESIERGNRLMRILGA